MFVSPDDTASGIHLQNASQQVGSPQLHLQGHWPRWQGQHPVLADHGSPHAESHDGGAGGLRSVFGGHKKQDAWSRSRGKHAVRPHAIDHHCTMSTLTGRARARATFVSHCPGRYTSSMVQDRCVSARTFESIALAIGPRAWTCPLSMGGITPTRHEVPGASTDLHNDTASTQAPATCLQHIVVKSEHHAKL